VSPPQEASNTQQHPTLNDIKNQNINDNTLHNKGKDSNNNDKMDATEGIVENDEQDTITIENKKKQGNKKEDDKTNKPIIKQGGHGSRRHCTQCLSRGSKDMKLTYINGRKRNHHRNGRKGPYNHFAKR
jgi:hypothetical protein